MVNESTNQPSWARADGAADLPSERANGAVVKGRKGFVAGRSGNPAGRPKGAKNKATLMAEALLEDEGEAIARRWIELAKAGNPVALKWCMDRLVPPRRSRYVRFPLPSLTTATDVLTAQQAVVEAVAKGELTPDEAVMVSGLLESVRKSIETAELELRLTVLEARVA